jgi:hypothetical protein
MSTGIEVLPSTSFTVPRHRKLVLFSIGRTIAIRVGLNTLAAMFSVKPPHNVADCPLTSRDEVATNGGPCEGIETLKGVFASCWHVNTCVNPRRLDMLIGINNAPSKANSARRDRSMEGTVGVCRGLRVKSKTQ